MELSPAMKLFSFVSEKRHPKLRHVLVGSLSHGRQIHGLPPVGRIRGRGYEFMNSETNLRETDAVRNKLNVGSYTELTEGKLLTAKKRTKRRNEKAS